MLLSRSALALLVLGALLTPPTSAQDLEPNLRRCAARLASGVVERIVHVGEGLTGLVVLTGSGADAATAEVVAGALRGAGFNVLRDAESAARPDVLALTVEVDGGRDYPRLVLRAGAPASLELLCGYGEASWVDAGGEHIVLVEGPLRKDRATATRAAREEARRRIAALSGAACGEDPLSVVAHRTFIGSEDGGAGALYRAFLQVEVGQGAIRCLQAADERAARREAVAPWTFGIGAAVLGVFLLGCYLKFDLRTRGYLSGRLALLFGTLFLIGVGSWGSLTL